jgi:hypothetical protein
MLQAMVCDIPPVRTPSRRRRCRPGKLDADKGYDSTANVPGCGAVGSPRGSLGVGSSRRSGSVATAGRSNARCRV